MHFVDIFIHLVGIIVFSKRQIPTMPLRDTSRFSICRKSYRLVLLLFSIFLVICCLIYYFTDRQEREVYAKARTQFENEVDALLELEDQTYIANIVDISYWDDCVAYIGTRNEDWFTQNVVYAMDTYSADYMAVFDASGKQVRKYSTSKITTSGFIPPVFDQLRAQRLMKFYIRLPEGYAQVFASSVHPTRDVKQRITPASGFFFIVKLLDKEYFEKLGRINNSQIALQRSHQPRRDHLSLVRPLKGYNGEIINQLHFERPFDVSFWITKSIVVVLIAIYLASVVIYLFLSHNWIYHPLNLVTRILEEGKLQDLKELLAAKGEFRYIGELIREHGEQKQMLVEAKARAEEGDRLKSSFLTNISHEIRTPMNAISGFSDLLLHANISDHDRQEYIKIINSSGRNLVSIIDDLIEMSKIDTNQVIPNYGPVDVEHALDELYAAVKISIPAHKRIDFQIRKPVNPLQRKIITDGVKMKQILTNLVTNAIKYTENGFVLFGYELDPSGEHIRFLVQDSGIGISKEHQHKVFERFHRVENDYTIKAGGLGLGLSISKAYVQMLGGTISFESGEFTGTTFTFTLPVQYADIAEAKPEIPLVVSPVKPITILVAEDDNINFLLIQKMLRMQQHVILRARDGQEAVDICQENPNLDLVLMDIKMPVLDGYQALQQVRLMRPDLPVIAQTAYASAEDEKKIMAFGFNAYISKPINKEKLVEIIETFGRVRV